MTKPISRKTDSGPKVIKLDDEHSAIVDAALFTFLQAYKWRAVRLHKSWYARIDRQCLSRRFSVSMHRLIANTPSGMICHHRNRNSLDNRRANLCNMTKGDHEKLHMDDNLLIKYESIESDVGA